MIENDVSVCTQMRFDRHSLKQARISSRVSCNYIYFLLHMPALAPHVIRNFFQEPNNKILIYLNLQVVTIIKMLYLLKLNNYGIKVIIY